MFKNNKTKWQIVAVGILLLIAGCDILKVGPASPEKPEGPSSLNVNEQGTFYSFVSSGDVDSVSLKFDFGDGNKSEWSEFVPVGDTVYATHAWQESGTYYVRAQAKDKDGNTSEWSDALSVSVGSQSSDSFALSQIGSFGKGGNVAISGNLLFVASKNNGLYIVDVTNPANPVELSNYIPQDANKVPYVMDVKVNGNYAYITVTYLYSSNTELEVLDIQNPSSPVSVGAYVDTSGHADFEKLYYDNGKCYVVGQYNTFRIIDVSNPQVPNVMGGVVLNNSVGSDIYVENGYAYVAAREMGIQIIDVSNPQNPREVASLDFPSDIVGISKEGNYLYLAAEGDGLLAVDVSDMQNIRQVGAVTFGDYAEGLYTEGNYAYLACNTEGFYVVDIRNPSIPTIKAHLDTPNSAMDVVVSGNYAYVNDLNSVRIIKLH